VATFFSALLFPFFYLISSTVWGADPSCAQITKLESGDLSQSWVSQQIEDAKKRITPAQKKRDAKIQKEGLLAAAKVAKIVEWHKRPFTKIITSHGQITDQKQSGDCWDHATLNDLKSELIGKGLVGKDFQFSRNFFYFYSMLEKSNSYFEEIISLQPRTLSSEVFFKDLKLNDTEPEFHIADGGEFSWMIFMIQKYGLVPYEAMPDTAVSLHDSPLVHELRTIVFGISDSLAKKINSFDAKPGELTSEQIEELRKIKRNGEAAIFDALGRTLGFPPNAAKPFNFQINQTKKQEKPVFKKFDPMTFARDFVKFDPDKYLSFSSTPLHPFNKAYSIKNHGTLGVPTPDEPSYNQHFVNVNSARLAQLVKTTIDSNRAVYFAADVMKDVDQDSGTMDPRLFEISKVLGINTKAVSRKGAVNTGLYSPDHAMAIVGYETNKKGQIVRFKVMNSWGRGVGRRGYFSMSIEWFNRYVFEATIDRSLASPHEVSLWDDSDPVPVDSFDKYYGPY